MGSLAVIRLTFSNRNNSSGYYQYMVLKNQQEPVQRKRMEAFILMFGEYVTIPTRSAVCIDVF